MDEVSGLLWVVSAAMLWGCWPFFLRHADLDSPASAFVTMCVMSLPAPLFLFRRSESKDAGAIWALLVLAASDALTATLYFAAVRVGPVAVAVLAHYLAPLIVGLAAPVVLAEPRSKRALIATPLSLLGLMLVLGAPGAHFPLLTAGLGAASAVSYAGSVMASKRAGRRFSPLAVTSLHAPLSALGLLAFARGVAIPTRAPTSSLLWMISGGLVCGLLAMTLFIKGLRRIRAQTASVLTYLEPITAAAIGWIAFGESLPWTGVAGAALVLAAGVWVAREPAKR